MVKARLEDIDIDEIEKELQIYRVELGLRIKTFRKKRMVSQEDLAYSCRIARKHMSQIENGIINCNIKTLYRIAKVLKVDISHLLDVND